MLHHLYNCDFGQKGVNGFAEIKKKECDAYKGAS